MEQRYRIGDRADLRPHASVSYRHGDRWGLVVDVDPEYRWLRLDLDCGRFPTARTRKFAPHELYRPEHA